MKMAKKLLLEYSVGASKDYRDSSLTVFEAILNKLEALAYDENEDLLQVSPKTIGEFLSKQKNLNTAKRYACFLDDFYAYLVHAGTLKESPEFRLRDRYSYPEKLAATTGFVNDEEERAFLAALPTPKTWKKTRDAALMALSLGTGLKLKEMINLDVKDVVLREAAPVVVVHHRHLSRAVPIREAAIPFVKQWIKAREEADLGALKEFFPATPDGGRLAPSTVWRQARKVLEQAGLDHLTHFGISALRVSYARIEAEHGRTVPELQHQLGHVRETSTVYLLKNGG
jgi:site-specific recombinase XerD